MELFDEVQKFKDVCPVVKLEQNPMVKEALLATKDYLICEYCVDEDTEWGLDKNGNGENKLGKAWMRVRDEIRKKRF